MKKIICAVLGLCFLCGCGTKETGPTVREYYSALRSVAARADITAYFAEESRSYTVACSWQRGEGATTTVLAPASLAGLSATVADDTLLIRYDGILLPAGKLSETGPANAIPWLLRVLEEGYLVEESRERSDGTELRRLTLDITAPDGTKLLCSVWLTEALAPVCGEFSRDGKVFLTVRITEFQCE